MVVARVSRLWRDSKSIGRVVPVPGCWDWFPVQEAGRSGDHHALRVIAPTRTQPSRGLQERMARPIHEMEDASWFLNPRALHPGRAPAIFRWCPFPSAWSGSLFFISPPLVEVMIPLGQIPCSRGAFRDFDRSGMPKLRPGCKGPWSRKNQLEYGPQVARAQVDFLGLRSAGDPHSFTGAEGREAEGSDSGDMLSCLVWAIGWEGFFMAYAQKGQDPAEQPPA